MTSGYESVDPSRAERLVRDGAVRVLDVRTPAEFTSLGHIPGALLLPVDLIPSGAATLPRDDRPLLVTCEHGVRSAHAADFLARAGFEGVLNMAGGMSQWRGPRDHSPGSLYSEAGPSSWLVECAGLLPPGGSALDVACGRGRHALLLAAARFPVRALDRDEEAIRELAAIASRLGLPVTAEVIDLEVPGVELGHEEHDLIVVFRYLHRPLFPALIRALRPGGLLLYETFTRGQAGRGRPSNPDYLLEESELPALVAPLEILRRREGEFDGGIVSAVAARKPA